MLVTAMQSTGRTIDTQMEMWHVRTMRSTYHCAMRRAAKSTKRDAILYEVKKTGGNAHDFTSLKCRDNRAGGRIISVHPDAARSIHRRRARPGHTANRRVGPPPRGTSTRAARALGPDDFDGYSLAPGCQQRHGPGEIFCGGRRGGGRSAARCARYLSQGRPP